MNSTTMERGKWSSKIGFILAAAGSAIGLGNIWKFPYMTYTNDGGAFVLTYLLAILTIGLPIMIAEIIIGRKTQLSPVGAMKALGGKRWSWLGWLGVSTGFIILSYYSVVAGWTMEYVLKSLTGAFENQTNDQVTQQFVDFISNPSRQLFWHALFMGITIFVVTGGVSRGLERAARILMPILFIIILVLVALALSTEGAGRAVKFLFRPNFSELSGAGFLEALGHAFFSLSLGMGAMITYGSYMSKEDSIPNAALTVTLLDTLIAILACLMIFPIIMTFDLVPTKSAGILFTTLPVVFMKLPGGSIFSVLFFTLVAFAALTSAISLLEVVASYMIDEMKWKRKKATIITGTAIFIFGSFSALSNGGVSWLSDFNIWGRETTFGFFNTFDYLASNYLLPIGGFFIAIFAGWKLTRALKIEELKSEEKTFFNYPVWEILIRYLAPLAVGSILIAVFLGREFQ